MPAIAPDGLNSILGEFAEDAATNAELWSNMPLWYWHSELTSAKPGASVIWTIEDALAAKAKNESPAPRNAESSADEYERIHQHALLATMNVGLGRVLYLAAPQTWRLRYVQTPGIDPHIEDLHRRFWGQVVRWAVGNDLPAGGKFVRFGAPTNTATSAASQSPLLPACLRKISRRWKVSLSRFTPGENLVASQSARRRWSKLRPRARASIVEP